MQAEADVEASQRPFFDVEPGEAVTEADVADGAGASTAPPGPCPGTHEFHLYSGHEISRPWARRHELLCSGLGAFPLAFHSLQLLLTSELLGSAKKLATLSEDAASSSRAGSKETRPVHSSRNWWIKRSLGHLQPELLNRYRGHRASTSRAAKFFWLVCWGMFLDIQSSWFAASVCRGEEGSLFHCTDRQSESMPLPQVLPRFDEKI